MKKILLIIFIQLTILSLTHAFSFETNATGGNLIMAKDSLTIKVDIYPNPFVNEINIKGDNDISGSSVVIYNAIGNLVKEFVIFNTLETIDVRDLHKGLYIIKIIKGNKKTVKRIIK